MEQIKINNELEGGGGVWLQKINVKSISNKDIII